MRTLIVAATAAALLVPATAARAGDPVMPLGEVRSGMQCTGYSVVRGTDVASFDVEVIDVVDDRASGTGPRILVRTSGPAVDETGIGPGFSGSPIYCPDAQGTQRSIGAISESIGEYGGKVVLATPIEAILGNPVDAPHAKDARATLARARSLAAPLTVTGLGTRLGAALQRAAAEHGRLVLARAGGPARLVPRAAAAPRLRVRGRLCVGRHRRERDRHRHLHRRRQGLGLRAPARRRRRARPAAPGRLRVPRRQQPRRDRGVGGDLQVRGGGA